MPSPLAHALLLLSALPLVAQERAEPPAPAAAPHADDSKPSLPPDAVTDGTTTLGGTKIPYRAVAGTITLAEEEGKERGHVFHVSYVRTGVEDPALRPVTFVFNGGPGSSSVWLHLGMLGPRKVELDPEGFALAPPGRLVDNAFGLLDVTDLVFIDPVLTGYSRPAKGETREQFHGLEQDAESVAEFIRLWTTREKRWASPKFLCGESYGTTRAAALSGVLQKRYGMYLNGIVLVSAILDFSTARFDVGNDLPYVLFLPTYAATAHFHGKLSPELSTDLRATLDEVEIFAAGEYRDALFRGGSLEPEERAAVAQKLARYTGLSEAYVESCDLRIDIFRFVKELLRSDDETVGRLDSRFRGRDRDSAGEKVEFDPSYAAIQGPFSATINDYLRRELGYESALAYEVLTDRVHPWSYGDWENRYVNVAETLRTELSRNPALRVYVANGYYDLATPYWATEYTFEHLTFDRDVAQRITMGWFEAGHMMYIREVDHARLRDDLLAFYATCLEER